MWEITLSSGLRVQVVPKLDLDNAEADLIAEREAHVVTTQDWMRMHDEREKAEAERDRYKKALEKIVKKGNRLARHDDLCEDCYETICDDDCPVRIAHVALGLPTRDYGNDYGPDGGERLRAALADAGKGKG